MWGISFFLLLLYFICNIDHYYIMISDYLNQLLQQAMYLFKNK